MKKTWRSCTALLMVFCLMLGLCGNGLAILAVGDDSESKGELHYVSIGDSMANGYGFVGYHQDSNDRNVYDFMTGKGMYGEGAYPLQFEAYLKEQGYDVTHTKLAPSALLAEDLLFLLDGREEFDNGWNGYKDYVGTYSIPELKAHFQSAIADADIITMGLGNASFGAFMLDRVTNALGVFGGSLDDDEKLNFEDAIAVLELDEEQHALIMEQHDKLKASMLGKIPAEYGEYDLNTVIDMIMYVAASHIVNYKLVVEKILEMNSDVQIVLVGLLNTTYGMNITDEEGNVIMAFGDTMDDLFSALNAYMAGLPALLQAKGVAPEAKVYYAEQPEPKFICQVFEELLDNGWQDIQDGRLSGETVRNRNISAFNDSLGYMIGMGVSGAPLARITLADVQAYEALDFDALAAQWGGYWNPWAAFYFSGYIADTTVAADRILAVAIYLGIEEAVARSTNTMDIQLNGLLKIAGDMSTVFTGLGTPPTDSPESTRAWLFSGLYGDEEVRGMCKIYGLFKVGNGMSVHPTPEGHDEIIKAVIEAYEDKHTAAEHAVVYLYEQLKSDDGILSDADKAQLISYVVSTLKGSTGNEKAELMLEIYQFLDENDYLTNEEKVDLVVYIYGFLLDGAIDDAEKATIFRDLYAVLSTNTYLSDDEKVEIVEYLYGVLKAGGYLGNAAELALIEDLYAFINENDYLTNEEKIEILVYVYSMMLDGAIDDADKAAIFQDLYDVLRDNTHLTNDEKIEIIEYIYGALKAAGYLDGVAELALIEDLYAFIDENNYLTNDQKVDILVYAYSLVLDGELSEADKLAVMKYAYAILNGNGQMSKEELLAFAAGISAILDKHEVLSDEDKVGLLEGVVDYLDKNGYIDAAKAELIAKLESQAKQFVTLLEKNLKPAAAKMEAELKELNVELAVKLDELNNELIPYAAQQEAILADMIAERDALVAELEALNAKLEAVKNGTYSRSAMVFSAKEEMIAELEADIAVTEAQIAELEEAIAWVANQLKTDKSGIEAIKAAIADVKANIIATEAALAEVNAAIDQLAADLAELNAALEVLVKAAEILHDKTAGKLDVKAVVEAVMTAIEKIPAIIKGIEDTYNKVAGAIEKAEAALHDIQASAAQIEKSVKALVESAEAFGAIVGEEADLMKQYAEELAAIVEAFVEKNQPRVERVLKKTYTELKELALEKLAKAEALFEENETVIYAALAIGYWYCEQKGYISGAKELAAQYCDLLKEKAAELKEKLADAELLLQDKLAEAELLLKGDKAALEAKLAQLEAQLNAAVDAETKAAIKAAIDAAEKQLAAVEAKIEEAKALIAAVKAYIAEVKAAIDDVVVAADAVAAAAKVVGKDIANLWKALKNLKSALTALHSSVVDLHDAVADEVIKLLGYCGLIADEAIDVVETLANYVDLLGYIPAMLEEAYIDAITDHYLVSTDSHYVALGDANAYGSAADKLAAHLTAFLGAEVSFENATLEGQSAAQLLASLPELKDTLAKADLVTVGFGVNTLTGFVVAQLQEAMSGNAPAEMDWEAYLGAEGARYVAEALAALKEELAANGLGEYMGMDISEILTLAIESYAYAYVQYMIDYVQVIEGIHAINPDAQVVLVGMHNPMTGVTLKMEDSEIAIGDYMNYLVEVSNAYALAYAFVVPETIFVDAPAVETVTAAGAQEVLYFVFDLMLNGTSAYVPTEEGYAYIEEQIWNALNVYKQGMLGDVNHDGKINSKDAVLVLRYATKLIGADALDLDLADVNGDGVYNSKDAVLILRFATGQITVFPAN